MKYSSKILGCEEKMEVGVVIRVRLIVGGYCFSFFNSHPRIMFLLIFRLDRKGERE